MKNFDWERFLQQYNIPYVDEHTGINVSRGNIGLACPLCAAEGNPDPSEHLGINPKSGLWNCWRRRSHRGRRPERLIRALLNCSPEEAKRIAKEGAAINLDSFSTLASLGENWFKSEQEDKTEEKELELPPEFNKFEVNPRRSQAVFTEYMVVKRGFKASHLPRLTTEYDLRWAITGFWAYRVIFPLYFEDELMAWTGRAVGNDPVRYDTLSTEPSSRHPYVARRSSKELVANYDSIVEDPGHTLLITEGPFDWLKTDLYGRPHGLRATALLGLTATDSQIVLIKRMARYFERVVVMLDNTTDGTDLADQLRPHLRLPLEVKPVPFGEKDPGDLTPAMVKYVAKD